MLTSLRWSGAAVLAHSLRDAGTTKKLAALITLDTLSADTVNELRSLYDYLIPVERIRNPNPANLFLMGRYDLLYAFTKIALWRQTQFRKVVYLDADVVALKTLDELFAIEASFAAAPDIGWPDAFNTGVMVLTPNMGEYWALQTLAATGDSFDGADQGLLNQYYENRHWHRLKFTYNCTPNAQYQWEPAYRYYKRDISAVHFIGKDKPWSTGRKGPGGFGVYNELLARWWAVYDRHLKQPSAPSILQSASVAGDRSSAINGPVHGEMTSADSSTAASQHITPMPEPVPRPEAPATATEIPLSEPGEMSENIDQGVTEPTPTVQQRKFSAPQMAWDATM
jgi:glycogenin glucosyltransferase